MIGLIVHPAEVDRVIQWADIHDSESEHHCARFEVAADASSSVAQRDTAEPFTAYERHGQVLDSDWSCETLYVT